MTFEQFHDDVISRVLVCGVSPGSTTVFAEEKRTRRLLAAAALVLDDRGLDFATNDPEGFRKEIFRYLGWAAQLALLFSGGGTWMILARYLIPIITELLNQQFSYPPAGKRPFYGMRPAAKKLLKG